MDNTADEDVEDVDDDDDDDVAQLPAPPMSPQRQRASVCAEANDEEHAMRFVPPSYPKSSETEARILTRLERSFLFNTLEMKQKLVVVAAMQVLEVCPGQSVVTQGSEGNSMYVVDSGILDCLTSKDGEEKFVRTISEDSIFGELDLLYHCPHSESVICRESSVLYQLDRETFNCIVKGAAQKKRHRHEGFLKSVQILSSLDPYDISRIADALKLKTHLAGEYIIREGDIGDEFFILEDGKVRATRSQNGAEETVNTYGPGDYFGELALLKDEPRAANIIADTDVTVLALDRHTFKRLLDPLQDILSRTY